MKSGFGQVKIGLLVMIGSILFWVTGCQVTPPPATSSSTAATDLRLASGKITAPGRASRSSVWLMS